jgi:hypothetical protein
VQLDDIIGATRCHLPENQLNHRLFLSTLLFITKIQKYEQQKQHPGHILLPVIPYGFLTGKPPAHGQ